MCAIAAVLVPALGGAFSAATSSKTVSARSPADKDDATLRTVRLLASHGEPQLALATLKGHEFKAATNTTRLAAGLLTELGQPASAESLLAREPTAAGTRERFRNQLVRARLLYEAGRYEASLAAIASIDADSVSAYAAYRDVIAARALAATKQLEPAALRLEHAHAHAPEALRDEINTALIEVYRAQNRPAVALAVAVDAGKNTRDPATDRRLVQTRFELALETGDLALAGSAARELFDHARRSEESEACAVALTARKDLDRFDTELLLSCASVLQTRGRRESLRLVLRRLDRRELPDAQSEEHRLLWGEYHFLGRDYSRAIALARPSYSVPDLRRRSILLMARSYRRVGRASDAAAMYETYAGEFPNDGLSGEALYTAASLYEGLGRDSDRTRVLDQLRHAYPSTFYGWAASMARARALDAEGADSDAAAIFEQWLARSRRTDEAALFYASRMRRSSGDSRGSEALITELRAVNPFSFYASQDLLRPVAGNGAKQTTDEVHTWMTDAAARRKQALARVQARVPADTPGRSAEVARALERGKFFLGVGFRDWAERELDVARARGSNSTADVLALAQVFDEHAMPWRSVRLYEKARGSIPWRERRESADEFRYLTHPVPFPFQVMTAARREEIAPYVLYGIMREESCFETDAVSRAGAVGLMQLMPETAREVARRLRMAPGADDRLGDPIVNVSIGSWYAADLLRDGDGSVVWMLAAYNAGPSAAGQWIRPGVEGEDAIDAVDSIDYKETRAYVKRVVEAANVYQSLYFDDAAGAGISR
jgi:soluble lytic murein transglycosylase